MAVICRTYEDGILKTAVEIEATVELDMCGKGRLTTEIELAAHLGICSTGTLIAQIDIHEIKPRTEFVGLECLVSDGQLLSVALVRLIQMSAEVIVHLDILCISLNSSYTHQHQQQKCALH